MIPKNYECPKCGSTEIKQDRHDKLANFELDDSDLVCRTCGYVDSEIKFLYDGQENLIKHTCRELGLTYKQLGEAIGFNGDTLNNMASKPNDKLSAQLVRAIELYLETVSLKKELEKLENLKAILKDLIK